MIGWNLPKMQEAWLHLYFLTACNLGGFSKTGC